MLFNHRHNLIQPLLTNTLDTAEFCSQLIKIKRRSFCILHDVVVVVREEILHSQRCPRVWHDPEKIMLFVFPTLFPTLFQISHTRFCGWCGDNDADLMYNNRYKRRFVH